MVLLVVVVLLVVYVVLVYGGDTVVCCLGCDCAADLQHDGVSLEPHPWHHIARAAVHCHTVHVHGWSCVLGVCLFVFVSVCCG